MALGQFVYGAALMGIGFLIAAVLARFDGVAVAEPGRIGNIGGGVIGEFATVIIGLLLLLGAGLVFFGIWTCIGAPNNFGARRWIIATVFCLIAFIGLTFVNVILVTLERDARHDR